MFEGNFNLPYINLVRMKFLLLVSFTMTPAWHFSLWPFLGSFSNVMWIVTSKLRDKNRSRLQDSSPGSYQPQTGMRMRRYDGWNPANQLRDRSFIALFTVFHTSQVVVCLGFLNHQQEGKKNSQDAADFSSQTTRMIWLFWRDRDPQPKQTFTWAVLKTLVGCLI